MGARDLAALILLGALWGASFIFIRVGVPVLGPFVLMDLRVLLAAAALVLGAVAVGRLPKLRSHWRRFLVLGFLNAAVPFTLIAASEINLTASLAAILNSTTPLFTAVVAAVWIGEALTPRRIFGLLLGIVGVALVVGWTPLTLSPVVLLSIGASLAAALSYGFGGVYAKRAFSGLPPLSMAIGQQTGAGLLLLLPSAVSFPGEAPSSAVVLSVLALALLSTALAYLLYFRLITSVGPTSTLTVTFLVPVFGLLFGALFLGEPVGAGMLVGLGVILSSVTLVTGIRLFGGREEEKQAWRRWVGR
jgi:drug/metabolite transporter (DMT)-like permease